ncbi:MAG: HAMP domain-containing sensor histidine kinase [Sulfurisoma sp.]|nr:HAMP domain-containing sensor histidine kinase [Sulfurisoma sp.]
MDAFVAAAIHDAKNSLNALGAWLDEAGRECPSPALHQAQTLAARLSAQLVELLVLYRAGEGTLRLAIDDHDVADFLADTMAELELTDHRDIAFTCDPGTGTAIGHWAFDAYLVRFALLDALRNALRHARSRVALTVALEPGGGMRFTVTDDGTGFPGDVLDGGVGEMAPGSSGLGIAFARLIAARHATPGGRHGHVELANANGASFSLVLP